MPVNVKNKAVCRGVYNFNPDRSGLRKKNKSSDKLIVVEVGKGFGHYYQYLFERFAMKGSIAPTAFNNHVTIVSNKEKSRVSDEDYLALKKRLDGKKVNVEYGLDFIIDNNFVFLEVFSEEFEEIRKSLNLPKVRLHITVGRFL